MSELHVPDWAREAIEALPERRRKVISFHDVDCITRALRQRAERAEDRAATAEGIAAERNKAYGNLCKWYEEVKAERDALEAEVGALRDSQACINCGGSGLHEEIGDYGARYGADFCGSCEAGRELQRLADVNDRLREGILAVLGEDGE